MNITWKIKQLDRRVSDGFVTTAHWAVEAVDGEHSASVYGTVGFDGTVKTPYNNLTEAQVLGWVLEQVEKTNVEAALEAQIQAAKNPVTATGLPW